MAESSRCAKCGSTRLVPGVRVADRGDGNFSYDLSLEMYEHPQALFFKGTRRSVLTATVCGDCGFTEFFVKNPALLLEMYQRLGRT